MSLRLGIAILSFINARFPENPDRPDRPEAPEAPEAPFSENITKNHMCKTIKSTY